MDNITLKKYKVLPGMRIMRWTNRSPVSKLHSTPISGVECVSVFAPTYHFEIANAVDDITMSM